MCSSAGTNSKHRFSNVNLVKSIIHSHFHELISQTHQRVTTARALKFHKFVRKWYDENVSDMQKKQCIDWFMGRQTDQIPNIITVKTQENDLSKTPYAPYNRYKVQHTN